MVYQCINSILLHLYPPTCLLCSAPADTPLDICKGCMGDLPFNRHSCAYCSLPLDCAPSGPTLCGKCQRKRPEFDRCVSPFIYRYPLSDMIGRLKFNNGLVYGRLLGDLLADQIASSNTTLPERLIPVPLHVDRLRTRGFNQASILARSLSDKFRIPIDYRSCQRRTATRAQSALKQDERRRNIRGAFLVSRRPTCRHVAIIDDVVTTGATANELARVLKQSGVERVDVWSCARTE